MNSSERAKLVLKILNKIYPTTTIPLKHTNNFTLLTIKLRTIERLKVKDLDKIRYLIFYLRILNGS